ncbi:M14 family metallopeptidase [Nocardioides litoris]|uniref:M14 family metallopeptidase n=1 Tax=Nocardioides litoris TaxID=1926648 RepID=UPI00111D6FED|nr:M14 family metallopeptidase [Nocardioides litoris]
MRTPRAVIGVTSLAVAATMAAGPSAIAEPSSPAPAAPAADPTTGGRGAGTATRVAPPSKAEVVRQAAETAVAGDPIQMPSSYPYQPKLRFFRANNDDAAYTAKLISHADLAPRLTELMAKSDRVSVQVVGQSTEGRDLYLVTLTAAEDEAETAQQAAWKDAIKNDPDAAKADTALANGYKTPVWISNNIHGNEWEGTDAAMQYIEYLATAPISEVGSILANNRLYFSPSLNPDGRTNATRATALGLDPNRDMITNTTPETRSFIRQAQAIQPIYAADFHGYTSVLQMEPCGPPHGSNYEYDLIMPHNYALALKVEKDVVAADIPDNTYYDTATGRATTTKTGNIKIPYRDTPDGWDDFPPIFTAQYAMFYGAAAATVELPLGRGANNGTRQTPERAVTNTAVALQTMKSIVGYMNTAGNAKEMIGNQIEAFRRGTAGEPKKALTVADVGAVPGPTQWRSLWDVVDNQDTISLPRAYVVPLGSRQRSASDARDLVAQLLKHDIEVQRLTAPATIGGTTYPAGSWVVDMHQPLRGLANALLDLGEDISAKVPSMYDVSAWSLGKLWGATVDKVGSTTDAPIGATEPVTSLDAPTAPVESSYTTFDLAGVSDYRVANDLLEYGVKVSMLGDGSVVVDRAGYAAATAAAEENGVDLETADAADLAALDDATTKPLDDLSIAYVGTQDDRLSLTELGFDDLKPVTAAQLNAAGAGTTQLAGVDVLWIGSSFADVAPSNQNPAGLNLEAARQELKAYADRGGSILGRGSNAFNAAKAAGLLTGTAVNGNSSGNGIVDVDTPAGSVLAPYAQETSFIYPAAWFTGLGAETKVEQTYDATKPFLAGHWRQTAPTTTNPTPAPNGPDAAKGQAAVVSSENATTGAKSLVFGTSVFFRTYPKGGMSQAARALFWAGPEGAAVVAPSSTTTTIAPVTTVRFPQAPTVTVTTDAGAGDATVEGTVELLRDGAVVASGPTSGGTTTLAVPGLRPGTYQLTARFTPSTAGYDGSTSSPVTVTVRKAAASLAVKAKRLPSKPRFAKGRVEVTLRLSVPGVTGASGGGFVRITGPGGLSRTVAVRAGVARKVVVRLPRGQRTVTATYQGNPDVERATARTTVRVR